MSQKSDASGGVLCRKKKSRTECIAVGVLAIGYNPAMNRETLSAIAAIMKGHA